MKESKFIELLNLYIDHQISPEDAALLEASILQNPRHRQIYRQYCRMQRACTIVLDRSQPENNAEAAEGRVVAFAEPRRLRRGFYAIGLAAAACLTFVVLLPVFRSHGNLPERAIAAAPSSTGALVKSSPGAAVAPVRMDVPAVHILPGTEDRLARQLHFDLLVNRTPDRLFFAASGSDNFQFVLPARAEPANRRTSRSSIEDFVFTQDPATPENPKLFRPRQPGDEMEENAVEFQR
jgi:anti-sigma factor RsiW